MIGEVFHMAMRFVVFLYVSNVDVQGSVLSYIIFHDASMYYACATAYDRLSDFS
jgi:hypothetical protein